MKFLFLCIANSTRSQIGEGVAKSIFGDSEDIQSAGVNPSSRPNPYALKVIQELGVETTSFSSKNWDELDPKFLAEVDYVITLCEENYAISVPKKAQRIHWPIANPSGYFRDEEKLLEGYRAVRDEIQSRLMGLKREIE